MYQSFGSSIGVSRLSRGRAGVNRMIARCVRSTKEHSFVELRDGAYPLTQAARRSPPAPFGASNVSTMVATCDIPARGA